MKKIALVAVAFLAFSCSEDQKSLKPVTIAEVSKATPELSSFVEALEITGLTSTFESEGNYTVFAPNDDAFGNLLSALGYATLQDLEDAKPGELAEILKFHVLTSKTLSTSLTDNASVTTLNGQSVTVRNVVPDPLYPDDNVISLVYPDPFDIINTPPNNLSSTIIARDVKCTNGLVHPVDTVMLPLSIAAE